ncbi:hypothetical protein CREGCYN_16130 [Synechococcus sp. M16CYN]
MPRYALLRHTRVPNDPNGCHVDLLLEDGTACRTWRLPDVPSTNGLKQDAIPLPDHDLTWLNPGSAPVSGGRGWAERIRAGRYQGELPANKRVPVNVTLLDGDLSGHLQIAEGQCCLLKL